MFASTKNFKAEISKNQCTISGQVVKNLPNLSSNYRIVPDGNELIEHFQQGFRQGK